MSFEFFNSSSSNQSFISECIAEDPEALCFVWSSLDEWFLVVLQSATQDAWQSARSKHFKQALNQLNEMVCDGEQQGENGKKLLEMLWLS